MGVRLGRAMRPLAICVMGLLMTGCIKLNIALQLQPNDTVNGSVIFAVNKQLLSLTGSTFDQITQGQAVLPSDVPAKTSDYDDGTYVGKRYSFENVPISRFDQSSSGDALKIQHVNDTYVVNGSFDLSSAATGDTSQLPNAAQLLNSADLSVAITFPGAVQNANGQITGNTVTWTLKFGQSTAIKATGSATSSGGGVLMWILIAAAVLIVLIVAVVLFSRRTAKAPAGEEGEELAAVTAPVGEAAATTTQEAPVVPAVSASEPSVPPPPPSGTTESSSPPAAETATEPIPAAEPAAEPEVAAGSATEVRPAVEPDVEGSDAPEPDGGPEQSPS